MSLGHFGDRLRAVRHAEQTCPYVTWSGEGTQIGGNRQLIEALASRSTGAERPDVDDHGTSFGSRYEDGVRNFMRGIKIS
jgi:hypothetical protein